MRDAAGAVAPDNEYPRAHRLAAAAPDVPWTVFLANGRHEYELLGFDFDARANATAAQADAWAFVALLERIGGLPFVLCESSSSGGRHVWVRPSAPLPAATVKEIATLAKRVYPTLDIAPLSNPKTGALRPPGAPHRNGSVSTVLLGALGDLETPSADVPAVYRLLSELKDLVPAGGADTAEAFAKAITPLDASGHRYLAGSRTKLGVTAQAALTTPITPDTDASHTMWQFLLGAARARWRYNDVLELLSTAPALEHARTERAVSGRRTRSQDDARRVLAYQWDRAAAYAASTQLSKAPAAVSDLDERVALHTALVGAALARADASPGRWSDPAEPGRRPRNSRRSLDRLVLDTLLCQSLEALTVDVAAAVRTLGMRVPVSHESVRQALHRLAADGWIALVAPAHDAEAAVWSIDPMGVFHREALQALTHGGNTPLSGPTIRANRAALLAQLKASLGASDHDLFSPSGIGTQAGRLYGHLTQSPLPGPAHVPGMTPSDATHALDLLLQAGVVSQRSGLWQARGATAVDRAATLHGVAGVLAARRHRYRLEQTAWSYWLAEREHLTLPAVLRGSRPRLVTDPKGNVIHLAPYPRDDRGRPSWRAALDRVAEAQTA